VEVDPRSLLGLGLQEETEEDRRQDAALEKRAVTVLWAIVDLLLFDEMVQLGDKTLAVVKDGPVGDLPHLQKRHVERP